MLFKETMIVEKRVLRDNTICFAGVFTVFATACTYAFLAPIPLYLQILFVLAMMMVVQTECSSQTNGDAVQAKIRALIERSRASVAYALDQMAAKPQHGSIDWTGVHKKIEEEVLAAFHEEANKVETHSTFARSLGQAAFILIPPVGGWVLSLALRACFPELVSLITIGQ
ncbi:hypothetical protein [Rhizobium sp. RAF56]|uniref:hypothetical protein n=1 Tax=Rhizobium sp. RAF56 TaxID=3233062 RepID=UPI003F96AFED